MMKKTLTIVISAIFIANVVGCGTIIYPERKGQIDGRIDLGVVALDAIGLLFFFIPGIVAFAVDFSNGTIYLPGGKSVQLTPDEIELLKAHQQGDKVDMAAVRKVAEQHNLSIPKDTSLDAMPVAQAESLPSLFQHHLVSNPSNQLASTSR